MKILMLERDKAEVQGIEWFLKTYLSYDIQLLPLSDPTMLMDAIDEHSPDVLFIEISLINATLEKQLAALAIPIIAATGEPIFQHALKAVHIHAYQLFVKPIPLEALKDTILSLPVKQIAQPHTNIHLYEALYLQDDAIIPLDDRAFFLIECEQFADTLPFYHWFIQLPIFESLTALPLQKRVVCMARATDTLQLTRQLQLIMQQWEKHHHKALNIAIYTGEEAPIFKMYNACKHALMRRFYFGYAQIFKSADALHIVRLDPLLSFEEQQLWITSLDQGDIQAVKTFLYHLTDGNFYHPEDVRIHLTSILAQIRRYMKKYHLELETFIEERYRSLFHYILEHPVLYAIIQEFILFTQLITDHVQKVQQQQVADYAELAVTYIEAHYRDAELTLQQVADALNISANYLSSTFSKRRGIPFKKFVQQYRLQRAAQLLMTTKRTIAAIAEEVGFVDHNYFSKVFRAYYQTTPYRYRLHHKKMS